MELYDIRITDIEIGDRRRVVDTRVKSIAASIAQIGLQNPIGVTKSYRLIHGLHRLEAFKLAGKETIPATIHDMTDMEAELAEIDENLEREGLTKIEEMKSLQRRKELYEAMHPETKGPRVCGGPGRGKKTNAGSAVVLRTPSFVADTAAKTGKSTRVIEGSVFTARNIPDDIAKRIVNTPIANNKGELDKLARLDEPTQRRVTEQLESGNVDTVAEATSSHNGDEERQIKGKGVQYAHDAINCLKRIPKNDALRKQGFQLVTDWIRHNR